MFFILAHKSVGDGYNLYRPFLYEQTACLIRKINVFTPVYSPKPYHEFTKRKQRKTMFVN